MQARLGVFKCGTKARGRFVGERGLISWNRWGRKEGVSHSLEGANTLLLVGGDGKAMEDIWMRNSFLPHR